MRKRAEKEFDSSAKNWIDTTIGEYIPFSYGRNLSKSDRGNGNYKVYGSNGSVDNCSTPYVKNAGLIIGRKGSIGLVHISKEPFWPIDTTFYIEKENLNELRFDYYLLKSSGLESMNTDSAVPGLNRDNAHSVNIKIPKTKKEREKIGKWIGSFDDKIDINRRINKTLEAMAETIFKSWFIDFDPVQAKIKARQQGRAVEDATLEAMICISGKSQEALSMLKKEDNKSYKSLYKVASLFPESFANSTLGDIPFGWKAGNLNDICEFQNGYSFNNPSEWKDKGHPIVKIGDIKPTIINYNNVSYVDDDKIRGQEKFALLPGNILIGKIGRYIGMIGMVPYSNATAYFNGGVGKFNINGGLEKTGFLYCNLNNIKFKEYVQSIGKGSAQPYINGKDIMAYNIIIPDIELLNYFNECLYPILDLMLKNEYETQNLIKMRDTLLPKVITGEQVIDGDNDVK